MKIVGYVFLGIFAIALIYGIYSISKILAIAKIRKNVNSEKVWQTISQNNRQPVALDRILMRKNNRKFTKKEKEMILKRISTCRKCILVGLLALILAIVFIVIG